MKRYCSTLLTLILFLPLFGSPSDSITSIIRDANIIEKADILVDLAHYYYDREPEKALEHANEALSYSLEGGAPQQQAEAYFAIGNSYYLMNHFNEALASLTKSLHTFDQLENKRGIAKCLNRIGNTYQLKREFQNAMEAYQEAMRLSEETGDLNQLSRSYLNMGSIMELYGDYENAIDYYLSAREINEQTNNSESLAWGYLLLSRLFKKIPDYPRALTFIERSLELYQEIDKFQGNSTGITLCLKEIADIYQNMGKFDEALLYGNKVLTISKEEENAHGVAASHAQIGKILYKMGDYDQALENLEKAIQMKQQLDDPIDLASLLRYTGNIYTKQGKQKKALQYLKNSLRIAKTQNIKEDMRDSYQSLSLVYAETGQFELSLDHYIHYTALKDSLTTREIAQREMEFEFNKRKNAMEREQLIQQEQLKRQKSIIIFSIAGLLLMILLAFLIYKNYKSKLAANRLLSAQNDEIKKKSHIIEEQNTELAQQRDLANEQRDRLSVQKKMITDSIEYARRIQNAILPQEKWINEILPEHFIFHHPRDIVSGDFYWFSKHNDKLYIAAVDCTGHGVPGAFMSMLGVAFLNEIVNKDNISHANEILNHLRLHIINALHQSDTDNSSKDGMDISLCIIDKKNHHIEFAGANLPLYIIADNQLSEIKGDRMPIGIYSTKTNTPFTNHNIAYQQNNVLYLFSDGYADQFGGKNKEKFKKKKLKELLLDIHQQPLTKQKDTLLQTLNDWKGTHSQIDDILLIGVKLP